MKVSPKTDLLSIELAFPSALKAQVKLSPTQAVVQDVPLSSEASLVLQR